MVDRKIYFWIDKRNIVHILCHIAINAVFWTDVGKFYAGPVVPDKKTQSAGVSGTLIMPASEFQEDGVLTAFELYAAGSTGPANFLVILVLLMLFINFHNI